MAQQSLCEQLPHPPNTRAVRNESKGSRTKPIAVSPMHDRNKSNFQAMQSQPFRLPPPVDDTQTFSPLILHLPRDERALLYPTGRTRPIYSCTDLWAARWRFRNVSATTVGGYRRKSSMAAERDGQAVRFPGDIRFRTFGHNHPIPSDTPNCRR